MEAELLNADGEPMAGYQASDSQAVEGDQLSGELSWKERSRVPRAGERGSRIRFILRKAKLYSFWVEPTRGTPAG